MKFPKLAAVALLSVSICLGGCTTLTSVEPALSNATGELWYVKQRWLPLPHPLVYYCPADSSTCYRARFKRGGLRPNGEGVACVKEPPRSPNCNPRASASVAFLRYGS